jgi:HEAT repeats
MDSISSLLTNFAFHATLLSAEFVVGLLLFIALRRFYRGRFFAKLDRTSFTMRYHWNDVVTFRIPPRRWRHNKFKRAVVERILLDRMDAANDEDRAVYNDFIRRSGLMEKRVWQAKKGTRHRRRQALLALGRTRLPEFFPVLEDAISQNDPYIQESAARALGQTENPEAALILLRALISGRLRVSDLTLKDSLLRTSRSDPKVLCRYMDQETTRLLIARILCEVADESVADDLATLAKDPDPEIRACAARGLARTQPLFGSTVLSEMAADNVWFVRLRAVVSMAKLKHPASMGALLSAICDSNRAVRQRAAEALGQLPRELYPLILDRIAATRDKYALHAFVSELERIGECSGLMLQLSDKQALMSDGGKNLLQAVEEARRQIAENGFKTEPAAEKTSVATLSVTEVRPAPLSTSASIETSFTGQPAPKTAVGHA